MEKIERRMKIGPKGQVVIPKEIRNELCLREGSEVLITLRDQNILVYSAKPITESYIDYFTNTYSKKLKKEVNIKKILGERYERSILH